MDRKESDSWRETRWVSRMFDLNALSLRFSEVLHVDSPCWFSMPSLDTDSRRWFPTLIHATRSHRRQMVMQASRHSVIEMAITWDSTLLSLQWRARSSNWELRQYAPYILCTPGAILHFQLWSSKRILSVKFVCPFCQSQPTKWQNIFFLLNVFSFSILLESSQSKVSGRRIS